LDVEITTTKLVQEKAIRQSIGHSSAPEISGNLAVIDLNVLQRRRLFTVLRSQTLRVRRASSGAQCPAALQRVRGGDREPTRPGAAWTMASSSTDSIAMQKSPNWNGRRAPVGGERTRQPPESKKEQPAPCAHDRLNTPRIKKKSANPPPPANPTLHHSALPKTTQHCPYVAKHCVHDRSHTKQNKAHMKQKNPTTNPPPTANPTLHYSARPTTSRMWPNRQKTRTNRRSGRKHG